MPLRQPSIRQASLDEPIRFESPQTTSSPFDDVEFNRITEAVKSSIFIIVKLAKMLDKSLKILGGRLDSKQERDQIQVVRAKARAVKDDTTEKLEKLNKMAKDQKSPGDQEKLKVKKLSSDVKAHIKWYTDLEAQIVAKLKVTQLPEQRPSLQFENETNDRSVSVGHDNSEDLAAAQQLQETLEFEQGLLLERAERIQQIEKDITEVNGIMQDLALLVAGQAPVVHTIAALIDNAHENVEDGNVELNNAVKIETKSRKRLMCPLSIGVLLLITVIVVLVISLK